MKTRKTFIATKEEVLDLLKLLAKLSNCYSKVDRQQKELVLSSDLNVTDRDLNKVLKLNRAMAKLDGDGFSAILDAEEIIMLDK